MQASARQQELERLYNARKGHVPHLSISDESRHITEAIGSYYGSEGEPVGLGVLKTDPRPLSYMSAPSESRFTAMPRSTSLSNRHVGLETSDLVRRSSERLHKPPTIDANGPPTSFKRASTMGTDDANVIPSTLSRHNSTDTAVQSFPLNDIDYESSPAAVAQELSNLQAIRRMSMNVDMADPDLPAFGSIGAVPSTPPGQSTSEDDPSKLFWVPARLHPELAPREFKTFVEERVDKIRRRSGSDDSSLLPDSLDSSGSGGGLRRKKSMLSHQIDTRGTYEDGAERLERKRSKGMHIESATTIANLHELEELVNDPAQLVRRMSLDTTRRSEDSEGDGSADGDVLLPALQQTLKRSRRTNYRRGSLRKGERVPFSKRALNRQADPELDEHSTQAYDDGTFEMPVLGLTRVQTEPIRETPAFSNTIEPPPRSKQRPVKLLSSYEDQERSQPLEDSWERTYSSQTRQRSYEDEDHQQPEAVYQRAEQQQQQYQTQQKIPQQEEVQAAQAAQPQPPQHRQFQSRIATQGRTTAQLPGYNNTNPLPHIIETLPDGTKIPIGPSANQAQQFPERKSSIEMNRPQRGAHTRPVPGRQSPAPVSTLDDISSNPSPMPGSGATRTDALTMIPTFEDKKIEKKETGRKSSWKWILGTDEDDKKAKKADDASSAKSSKSGKPGKNEKARLDVLQSSIDGNAASRPRESIVLNRDDIKIEDDRKSSGKKSFDVSRKDKDVKEPSLLSAIFGGGKKKSSDPDIRDKKRKGDRALSPEPPPRILKADIDYNWTRFSILEERAIYRMAHIKLANPRRALYSQVLLSNFMYSYLAKVQMMHPTMQIPQQQQTKHQEQQQQQRQQQQQQQQQQQIEQQQRNQQQDHMNATQPSEYQEQQRWQEQSQQATDYSRTQSAKNSDYDTAGDHSRQYEHEGQAKYDVQHSGEHPEWPVYQSSSNRYGDQSAQTNGHASTTDGHDGYSVASGHDYLGYTKDQRGYSNDHMWEEEEGEDLW